MRTILNILISAYGLACLGALALIPISAFGILNMESDPLSAIYAVALGMPWSFALRYVDITSPIIAALLIALGMMVNLAILVWIREQLAPQRLDS